MSSKPFKAKSWTQKKSQLVLRLTTPTQPNHDQSHTKSALHIPLKVNQRIKQNKETYLGHWTKETESPSILECCLFLKRDSESAQYLSTVRNRKQRQILSRDRLSEHQPAIEKGSQRDLGNQKKIEYVNTVRQVKLRQRCTSFLNVKKLPKQETHT